MRGGIVYMAISFFMLPAYWINIKHDGEMIDWNASRKLSWSDYKADPDRNSDAAASTTTYLDIEYTIRETGFDFKIQCRFSPKQSWGLHKTDYILAHEQGHFDIAEIFARKLNKAMIEYRFNPKTYKKDLEKIYDGIVKEKEEMQNAYDKETNHSIKKEKQKDWLIKIETRLNDFADYANYN